VGLRNETTEAHGLSKRPSACTQNMGLPWSCHKTRKIKDMVAESWQLNM